MVSVEALTAPVDLNAERSVLGACLVNDEALNKVFDRVSEDQFYSETHRQVYTAIRLTASEHRKVDNVLVAPYLQGDYNARKLLFEIVEAVPTAGNVDRYIDVVQKTARLRDTMSQSERLTRAAASGDEDGLKSALGKLLQLDGGQRRVADTMQASLNAVKQWVDITAESKGVVGIRSGIPGLDKITAGFEKAKYYIIAARPAMGKSQLLGIIAVNAARQGYRVLVQSSEMAREVYHQRLAVAVAGVDAEQARAGNLNEALRQRIKDAAEEIAGLPIWVDDDSNQTVARMRLNAMRFQPDMIIVDYLQRATPDDTRINREQQITQLSGGIDSLKKEFNCAVVAAAQLSRAVEMRKDKRPMLSDLRECLPIDEWISTPSGPVQLGTKPKLVSTLNDTGIKSGGSRYIPKMYNSVYEVKSQYGTFRATARHEVLTGTGWKQVRDLKPGRDVLASAKHIDHANKGPLPHARLLGWMIGNGGCSGTPSLIYRKELNEAVQNAVASLGVSVKARVIQKSENVIDAYLSNGVETGSLPNPLMNWIRSLGLEGKTAYDKFVPNDYLGSSDQTHRDLLLGLWEADGTVTNGAAKYTTVSEVLARQISWLLLTCGIRSTVNFYSRIWEVKVCIADNDTMRAILNAAPVERFGTLGTPSLKYIDPAPAVFTELAEEITPRALGIRFQKKPGGYKAISKERMKQVVSGQPALSSIENSPYMTAKGVGWGSISSVTKLAGEIRVADLNVPETHNFIANGIVVHNSGSIEQDADMAMFLYVPNRYDDSQPEDELEIYSDKNRHGPLEGGLFYKTNNLWIVDNRYEKNGAGYDQFSNGATSRSKRPFTENTPDKTHENKTSVHGGAARRPGAPPEGSGQGVDTLDTAPLPGEEDF